MSSISFTGVTKQFGDTIAVDDFTLDIAAGEFLVLLGPSGCGKSTALRMLAGLETPTAGTVSIDGAVVNDVDARNRDVAMVFQSYALYPHMTVAANIESPLIGRRSEKHTKTSRREQVEAVAATLGLQDLLERKPAELSGGQRQRVALARAIVRRPAVFCMDEPLSNLDASLRTQTRAEIVELHRSLDTTFVYVTHDQVEAMTMATCIAVIDQGRLQQVGDPRTIYDRPANEFVARFIGSPPMNLLSGRVELGVDGPRILSPHGELSLGSAWAPLREQAVTFGFRPEDAEVSTRGISAVVRASEWLGHEQLVTLDADGSRIRLRLADGVAPPPLGDRIALDVAPQNLHLFDPDTGRRLVEGQP